jgi:hypothetical protein
MAKTFRFTDESLAERYRDPANEYDWFRANNREYESPVQRQLMISAKRYVMDEAATRLAVQLSTAQPRTVLQQLDAIEPPAPVVWIEWPSEVFLEERAKLGTLVMPREHHPPQARTGALIEFVDNIFRTWCIEDGFEDEKGDFRGKVICWPISYHVALTGTPYRHDNDTHLIWGYQTLGPSDVTPLKGRAIATVHPSIHSRLGPEGELVMLQEMQGWTRLVVATLAMFSTVSVVETLPRPAGRVLLGGVTRPRLQTDRLVLRVPRKIRKVVKWAQRAISNRAAVRHKLHEVSEHYRHLDFQPRAEGWEAILMNGEAIWRKKIARHLRGDPALGVVEHKQTFVVGPS